MLILVDNKADKFVIFSQAINMKEPSGDLAISLKIDSTKIGILNWNNCLIQLYGWRRALKEFKKIRDSDSQHFVNQIEDFTNLTKS